MFALLSVSEKTGWGDEGGGKGRVVGSKSETIHVLSSGDLVAGEG